MLTCPHPVVPDGRAEAHKVPHTHAVLVTVLQDLSLHTKLPTSIHDACWVISSTRGRVVSWICFAVLNFFQVFRLRGVLEDCGETCLSVRGIEGTILPDSMPIMHKKTCARALQSFHLLLVLDDIFGMAAAHLPLQHISAHYPRNTDWKSNTMVGTV